MSDWWEDAPLAPADDPNFTGYIPGVPKPKEPKPYEPPAGYSGGPDHLTPIPGGPADKSGDTDKKDALKSAIGNLGIDELVANIGRARGNMEGGWSTGITGAIASHIPGTQATNFRAQIEAIKGGLVLEKLQALKDASKTGASGMGALSDREGDRLAASVAALNPNMSDDELARSLNDIERHAKTLQVVRDGKDPNDPSVQKAYGLLPAANDATTPPGGATLPPGGATSPPSGDIPPGGRDPTPKEQTEFFRILKSQGVDEANKYLASTTGRAIKDPEAVKKGGFAEALDYVGDTPFMHSFNDIAGGVIKGAAALPDMAAKTVGSVLAAPLDWAGYDEQANQLRNPVQIGQLVDEKIPLSNNALAGVNRFGGELVGGAVGFPAKAANAVAEFVAGRGSREAGRVPNVIQQITQPRVPAAAQEENVRIVAPMLEGQAGRRAAIKAGKLEADPNSRAGAIIQQGLANVSDDIEAGVTRLGRGGTAQTPGAMGERLRSAAAEIEDANRIGHEKVYEAARAAQPDAAVDMASARARIDAKLQELALRPNQNRATIQALKRYRADLDQPLPLDEVRKMRTQAWDNMQPGNMTRSSEQKAADRFMKNVIDGANSDIKAALRPEAQKAWDEADALFRTNKQLYKTAIQPVFGNDLSKLTGEQIFSKIQYAAGKDARALRGLHKRMDADTSRDLAATIAEGLGKQHEFAPFSPMTFVRSAAKISPEARATFFGESGARSIENLQLLSRRLEVAQRQINTSKTARPVATAVRSAAINLVSTLLGAGTTAGVGPAAGVGVGLAAKAGMEGFKQVSTTLSAKALMNPRVSAWLRDTAGVANRTEAREMQRRLGVIIDRDTALAGELTPIHNRVHDWLNQPLVQSLAAQPAPEGGDNEQR